MATTKKTKRYLFHDAGSTDEEFVASTAITALTDSSGGTAGDTLPAIEATYTEATIEDTVASLAAKINEILTALQKAGIRT